MITLTCRAVVMDIEGTTSAARHVYDVLFPYARSHMRDWIAAHGSEPATAAAVAEVAADIGVGAEDSEAIIEQLLAWIDDDVKAAPLKTLQGLIWSEGYARGELTSHMFPDVRPALVEWDEAGLMLAIYSSGSVAAQKALFANAPDGDLTPLLGAYFDITTAGPKREEPSYRLIADQLGMAPGDLLFLSDIQAELDAAAAAGWQVVGLLREGETQATATGDPHVESFEELSLRPR